MRPTFPRRAPVVLVLVLALGCSRGSPPPGATPAMDGPPRTPDAPPLAVPDAAPSHGRVVVAAAGDIAGNWVPMNRSGFHETSELLRHLLATRNLRAILALGDLQYPWGALADFMRDYHPSWGRPELRAITRPVPGNHEYGNGTTNAEGYYDYFNGPGVHEGQAGARDRGYYSFDLGAWHFVALNSSHFCSTPISCAEGSPQHRWLVEDLARTDRKCVLAYWHHPRFHFGAHEDTPPAAPLWNALYDAGAEIVLYGHDHDFQHMQPMNKEGRLDPRGIRSFVVGTGGIDIFYRPNFDAPNPMHHSADPAALAERILDRHGVLELTLDPDRYEWRFIAVKDGTPEGEVLASGSGVCR